MGKHNSIDEIIKDLKEVEDRDGVTFSAIAEKFGSRGYGPILVILAVVAMSPIGAIPGASFFLCLAIFLVAIQMILGRSSPWFPAVLRKRSVSSEKYEKLIKWLDGWSDRAKTILRERLTHLTGGLHHKLIAVIIIFLAITFIPLSLIPFGVFFPAFIILLFALGITVKDGLMIVLGWAGSLIGFAAFIWFNNFWS